MSSNYIPVTDRKPATPSSLTPANGSTLSSTPQLSSVFSDPDPGQTGYVSYALYNDWTGLQTGTGSGPYVSSGSRSAWTPSTLAAGDRYDWDAQAGDSTGGSSVPTGYQSFDLPPTAPSPGAPASPTTLQTATPVLSASGASSVTPAYYEFQVATDQAFSNVVADSGALPSGTTNWTVPAGALQDGTAYFWRVGAWDAYGDFSPWSTPASTFTVSLPKLGVNSDWPMWSHGPVSVNEANGNLVFSLPTPSYPTTTGSLTFSLTYNSQAPAASSSPGLGAGWTLSAGDGSMSPPSRLIDHSSGYNNPPTLPAAEIVWPDGSSEYYNQAGSSTTYLSAAGDGSQLTKDPNGDGTFSWTLLDSDGTSYSFGTESSSGVALLASAQTPSAKSGDGILTYQFDTSGKISQLGYQDTSGGQPSETLTFTWLQGCNPNVTKSFLCITGSPDQRTWTYADADRAHPDEITAVNDGTRQLFGLTYNANGLLSEVQNADDLNPSQASPNYNASHSLGISYDSSSPARVLAVSDGPVTTASGPQTSTWSFSYHPGTIEPTPPRASHYGYLVRNAAPAAYYPLDETSGTTAVDASGNGNNATYSGSYSQGQAGALAGSGGGTAVTFSGGTVTGNVANLDLAPGGYNTVAMWINWNGTDDEMPFSFGPSPSDYDLWLYDGYFGFNSDSGNLYGAPLNALTPNTWHFVVAEFYNGALSSSKLWIDGVPQPMAQRVGVANSAKAAPGFNISGDSTGGYRFSGTIDETSIYGYALSPNQIAAQFAEGVHDPAPVAYYRLDETSGTTAADSSGNDNNGTYTGSWTSGGGAYAGSASSVNFTGGGTVAGSVPNLNTTAGAYTTVEMWLKWDGTGSVMPFGFGSNYDLYFDDGYFGFNTGCGDLYGTTAPTANTWHYVVAEFYNGQPQNGAKLWVDGVPQSLSVKLGTPCSQTVSSNFDISGWPHDGSYRMHGSIDEVAIYNTALTPAEIANHYATNQAGGLRNGAAAGYTTVTPPNKQGMACPANCETDYYNGLGRSIETIDILGHTSETSYNAQSQPLWSEDADGNPTDYLYGGPNGQPSGNPSLPVALLQTIGPDPDGSGPLSRPVTTNRYDERAIGTVAQAGTPLTGLAATYWPDTNLSGTPAAHQTDPTPGTTGSFTLPVTGGSWPVSGSSSAQWTGDLIIPSAGDYTFSTVSDGGTRLTVDGVDEIENWQIPSQSPYTATSASPTHLSAGLQPIVLSYEHNSSATQTMTLEWSCSDCAQPISPGTPVPLVDLAPAWFNQTSTISPQGRLSFSHYASPELGQSDYSLVQVGASNLITSYSYDPYGRLKGKVMPDGNSSATISASGDLSGAGDPTTSNWGTSYIYYAPGAQVAPPNEPDCSGSSVNQNEQLDTATTHGDHTTTYVYDASGNTIAATNGAGTTCSQYDAENRLQSTQAPGDSAPTTYTYDPSGATLSVSGPTGTNTTYYDEQGRLVKETDQNHGGSTYAQAAYNYDLDGNTTSRIANTKTLSGTTCPSSTDYCTTYSYNAADQLTSETDPAGNSYAFYYDDRGNLRGTQYPNGTFSWTDTNPDGWTTDQYNRHGTISATTTPSTVPTDTNPLADYTYTYNEDGKRTVETRTSASTSQTTNYTYDNLGRLSQDTITGTPGSCRQYSYDLDSNRLSTEDYTNTGCTGTVTTTNYTYDPNTTAGVDELTKITAGSTTTNYTYTSDGQTQTQGTTNYTWDGRGRLSTATVGTNTITYTYDPTGALMSRTSSSPATTIDYLLGDLVETNASGTITTSYTDGPSGDLASYNGPPTSTPTYLYYDAHGNLAAEANTSGNQTANHTYDPFGAPLDSVPANTTTHRFVGRWNKQYDTTTGLILMGARPYNPTTGRFLSVDPIPGGSLNNYDYADQDPINNYDLNGTCAGEDCEEDEPAEWYPRDDATSGAEPGYGPNEAEARARGRVSEILRDPAGTLGRTSVRGARAVFGLLREAGWTVDRQGGAIRAFDGQGNRILLERNDSLNHPELGEFYWRVSRASGGRVDRYTAG